MKRLWAGQPTVCPECQSAELVRLHKRAKRSNNNWKCPQCGQIYRTIRMIYDLPDE